MMAGNGDLLPTSAFPVDGTWPTGTTKWEKRNIALDIPVWDEKICIQCNKCAAICPHAAIRPKVYEAGQLDGAPATFKSVDYKGADFKGQKYTIQVAPEDCTGCGICVAVCPPRTRATPSTRPSTWSPAGAPARGPKRELQVLPEPARADRTLLKNDVKGTQFMEPLFEFSGACAGCGETPYIKLMTQMFGDRALIANATGCSSIYGGNLPTTPYTTNADGRGPAWSNSLFEDNAEFGLGFRLALDKHNQHALEMLLELAPAVGDELVAAILAPTRPREAGIKAQRERVAILQGEAGHPRHPRSQAPARSSPTTW
jgi:pyruvate-ferredoxin/flavodoxin oxidoreductase